MTGIVLRRPTFMEEFPEDRLEIAEGDRWLSTECYQASGNWWHTRGSL